jgi:hypothetical protein
MATSAERMRAARERARRGLRRLTIDVSEDDLRAIAKRGYEGAVTTGHESAGASCRPVPQRCPSRRTSSRRSPGRAIQRRQTRTRDAAEAIGRSTIAFLDRTG